MMKRRRMKKSASKKLFRKTATAVHKKNRMFTANRSNRGGIRA